MSNSPASVSGTSSTLDCLTALPLQEGYGDLFTFKEAERCIRNRVTPFVCRFIYPTVLKNHWGQRAWKQKSLQKWIAFPESALSGAPAVFLVPHAAEGPAPQMVPPKYRRWWRWPNIRLMGYAGPEHCQMFYNMNFSCRKVFDVLIICSHKVLDKCWSLYLGKIAIVLAAVLTEKETEGYFFKVTIPYITIFHMHIAGDFTIFAFKVSNESTHNGPH